MNKIYIATRGSEAGIIRHNKVRDALAPYYSLTFDWSIGMRENFAKGIRDTDLTFEQKRELAVIDRRGVLDADVVVYLEDEKSEGSAGEFCYAEHAGKTLFAVCAGIPRCLFVTLADRIFRTDEELVAFMIRQAEDVLDG